MRNQSVGTGSPMLFQVENTDSFQVLLLNTSMRSFVNGTLPYIYAKYHDVIRRTGDINAFTVDSMMSFILM